MDVQRLLQAPGYVGLIHRHSWVDSSLRVSANELNAEVDSITSSPGMQKVSFPTQVLRGSSSSSSSFNYTIVTRRYKLIHTYRRYEPTGSG